MHDSFIRHRSSVFSKLAIAIVAGLTFGSADCQGQDRNLVIIAGKPSHGPRIHEFNAGVQLLVKCLADVPGVNAKFVLNGWPMDESILESADACLLYTSPSPRDQRGSRMPSSA